MIFQVRFNQKQRGFTLIEIILAIALTGIIVGGITMTIFQVFSVNTRSSDHMVAIREVQNAGYWISRDAQMAQEEPDIGDDPTGTGFPLTLTWKEYGVDGDVHQVEYTLVAGELKRTENGETTMVAKFIDSTKTECQFIDANGDGRHDTLRFTVTATVGKESETKVYQAMPRPKMEEK